MLAKYVPAQKTPVTPAQVVAAYRQACLQLWNTGKPETIAVLVAHSALETGRWASMYCNNLGNVKASAHYQGLFTCLPLINEIETRNGKRVTVWYSDVAELSHKGGSPIGEVYPLPPGHPQSRFRAFERLSDGVIDKITFLNRHAYRFAKDAALVGNPSEYSKALSASGYYTADEAPYTRAVVSLFNTYLPMARQQANEPVVLRSDEEEALCADMAACTRFEPDEILRRNVEAFQIPHQDLIDFTDRSVNGASEEPPPSTEPFPDTERAT